MDTWGDRMEDPGRGGSGQDPPAAVRAAPGSEETSPGPSLRGPWIHSWEAVGSFGISSPSPRSFTLWAMSPQLGACRELWHLQSFTRSFAPWAVDPQLGDCREL